MFKNTKPKVLIVEDDANNHPLFREAYESVGFDVMITDNADDNFIDGVVALKPDIISMDLMIGKQGDANARDGFEAMELLQSDGRTKEIPVMVASNFFQDEKVARARELGARDYFNLQGRSLTEIAEHLKAFTDAPKKYTPTHPMFQ